MRHQPQPEQITRLLLQKASPYAELDENTRIACSVLQGDGWAIQRLDLEGNIQVVTTTIPVDRPGTEAALAEAQAKFIILREQFHARAHWTWTAACAAFAISGALNYFHLNFWSALMALICVLGSIWTQRRANGPR